MIGSLRHCGLLVVVLVGCGSGQRSSAEGPAGGQAEERAQAAANAPLAAALGRFCEVVAEEAGDRSVSVERRLHRVQDRLAGTEHDEVLDRFFDGVSTRESGDVPTYEAIVAAAARQGVPGWSCAPIERVLALLAAGEDDIDPERIATAPSDFDEICRRAREVIEDGSLDPADRAPRFVRGTHDALTNPAVLAAFEEILSGDPPPLYDQFVQAAARAGVADWSCPELDALLIEMQ